MQAEVHETIKLELMYFALEREGQPSKKKKTPVLS